MNGYLPMFTLVSTLATGGWSCLKMFHNLILASEFHPPKVPDQWSPGASRFLLFKHGIFDKNCLNHSTLEFQNQHSFTFCYGSRSEY